MSALQLIIDALQTSRTALSAPYHVPGLWLDFQTPEASAVNPYEFYADVLRSILKSDPQPLVQGPGGGEWTRRAVVYNLLPRLTTAYDHAHDDDLSIEPSVDGWRDTGTLLKTIALLPYLKSLNINTIHLLPVNTVGQHGKKGTLGSPYAIRNAYQLDERLAEPALDVDVDTLFAGLVEAAHHLGLRVVMEFVLRTASRDADWIGEHPDWFYWIREDVPDRKPGSTSSSAYGYPIFSGADLSRIRDQVARGDLTALPVPSKSYRKLFTPPPRPERVRFEDGRWIGELDDGTRVRVPGAFCDWPPDDNQPPWSDVTYLRMYDHPDFNYIAYNTLRMYDPRLAQPENAVQPLWDAIAGVIPHYQQAFGIDGVLIDMGHALPSALKARIVSSARQVNPDFAFWDENYGIDTATAAEGYNAVVGYMLLDLHQPGPLWSFLHRLANERLPLPFFATPENHNTPRAYSRAYPLEYAHYALMLSVLVPGIPFIHSGFELMEARAVNTGLGFSDAMIRANPSESLPLFNAQAFNWTRPHNLVGSVRYALQLRQQYADLLSDPDPRTFRLGRSSNPNLIVLSRQNGAASLVAVANSNMGGHEAGQAVLPVSRINMTPLWGTDVVGAGEEALSLPVSLPNGGVQLFDGDHHLPGPHRE
ncbi:alpha-amylase [Aggregatilinea lenta]|uniref:alpha-amylase n=1 Tax=Aggregatilinea lenta TaxID=913108 RepID=UPI000E5B7EF4|nr:alpha-amylase [Aggregatilinea lenta]